MKRAKRLGSLALALCLLLAVLPVFPASAEVVSSGECGTGLTWELDSAGTLTIRGTGEMECGFSPWEDMDVYNVVIEDGVTGIGGYSFYDCHSLTSITIPDSVQSIGGSAFFGCTGLISITLPDGVTDIGLDAFYTTGYYNDKTNWENGVLYIGKHLIEADSITGNYEVKAGTKTIANSAFSDCTSLTGVTIPDSVQSIGDRAFGYDNSGAISGFTITGYRGTAAETYAVENGFVFVDVEAIVWGSVNDEEGVTASDALLVLQCATGKAELTGEQWAAANVDGKGGVAASDALMILQYATEKIASFPVQI